MLCLQEVTRIDLVDRDTPERRQVEVAQMLLLAILWPCAIDVRQVVIGAARLRFEGARRPHACGGPAEEIRRWSDHYRFTGRDRHDGLTLEEFLELLQV